MSNDARGLVELALPVLLTVVHDADFSCITICSNVAVVVCNGVAGNVCQRRHCDIPNQGGVVIRKMGTERIGVIRRAWLRNEPNLLTYLLTSCYDDSGDDEVTELTVSILTCLYEAT